MMNHAKDVREFVINTFLFGEGGSLKEDTSFLDSGIVDSTGMLELIMFLEETYGIKVEPEEMVPENLDSVAQVNRFLETKRTQLAGIAIAAASSQAVKR